MKEKKQIISINCNISPKTETKKKSAFSGEIYSMTFVGLRFSMTKLSLFGENNNYRLMKAKHESKSDRLREINENHKVKFNTKAVNHVKR